MLALPSFDLPSQVDLHAMTVLPLLRRRLNCTAQPSVEPVPSSTSQCAHLGLRLDDQLDAVLASAQVNLKGSLPVVWTVVDRHYAAIALDQNSQLISVGLPPIVFVSVDSDMTLAQQLCLKGLATINFSQEFAGLNITWTVKLRVAKAKFVMPGKFLSRSLGQIFTEMDVFWLRNPLSLFKYRAPGEIDPNIVFGTHYDNPWSPNIGMWYVPHDAPLVTAQLFLRAWEVIASSATPDNAEDPYAIHDQYVLQLLLRDTHVIPVRLGNRLRGKPCDSRRMPYCALVNQTGLFKHVVVRLLENTVISSWLKPMHDEHTVAIHILGRAPLLDAKAKIAIVKSAGLFYGGPHYYERFASQRRYFAWDGLIQAMSMEHGFCPWPKAGSCGLSKVLPLLFAMAISLGRTAVLPKHVDSDAHCWNTEVVFDIASFEENIMNKGQHIDLRESSFLNHPQLNAVNMYPVARLWLHSDGWTATQMVSHLGLEPRTSYRAMGQQSLADALMALLVQEDG